MKFDRLLNMIGEDKFYSIKQKRIVVFGLGGVGSFTAEALVRSGIGTLYVVDYDLVEETNINRQLIALESTIGKYKVDVFKERAKDINHEIKIIGYKVKADKDTIKEILQIGFDYVVDCVDDLNAKAEIAMYCLNHNINLISSMGFANKFKPEMIKIAKLNQTSVCPLAKALRKKLKNAGYSLNFNVVYSEEKPAMVINKEILGSNAYCPSVAGLYMAAHIVNEIIGENI